MDVNGCRMHYRIMSSLGDLAGVFRNLQIVSRRCAISNVQPVRPCATSATHLNDFHSAVEPSLYKNPIVLVEATTEQKRGLRGDQEDILFPEGLISESFVKILQALRKLRGDSE